MVKQNFIDQGSGAKNRHGKNKVFERTYESHLKPEIFRQILSDALLDETDVATLYYPRQDALLLGLYNKAKGPQERNMAEDNTLGEGLEGERTWRAAYRVMPDF